MRWAGKEDFIEVIREEMGHSVKEPELYPDLAPVLDAWWMLTGGSPPVSVDAAITYRNQVPVLLEHPIDEYLYLLRAADNAAVKHLNKEVKRG